MRSGLHPAKRASRLVAAIGRGIETSCTLAAEFGTTVGNIAPELHRLARMGAIARAGKVGRCVRWRML